MNLKFQLDDLRVFCLAARKASFAATAMELGTSPAFVSKRIAAENGEVTAERFKAIVNEIKTETGTKGKELFHPIRIAIIGSHSGPEFDKLIPIIEAGSKLELPVHVKSVRERVEEFGKTFAAGKS